MSTEGLPTGDGLIALVAVARQSVTDVPMLHNFAVGLGRQDGIPNSVIVSEAEKLQLRFASAGTTASKSGGEASEALATAFRSYADLAGQLGAAAEGSEPLPEGFAAALTRADSSWRAAVQAVAKADGSDLLATLPPLLMPDSPSSKTIPPPPK